MSIRSFFPRLALPLAASGFAVLLAAVPSPARAANLLGDGAVIDTARSIAYIAQPQGGIEALDLATGKAVWRTPAGAKPLALLGDGALLAQDEPGAGGTLRLAVLDTATGAARVRTELALPAGIAANVTDNLRVTFRVRAAVLPGGDGSVVLAWNAAVAPPLRGSLPPDFSRAPIDGPAPAARAGGFRRGAARLDLATGRAFPVADSEVADLTAALERNFAPGGSTGAADQSHPSLPSIDGRQVLTSERVAGSLHTYRWSISDRATGAVIAVLDAPVSLAPFVVVGPKVLYLAQPSLRRENGVTIRQELRLRALDLAIGSESWQAVVRDSAYRGPIPP